MEKSREQEAREAIERRQAQRAAAAAAQNYLNDHPEAVEAERLRQEALARGETVEPTPALEGEAEATVHTLTGESPEQVEQGPWERGGYRGQPTPGTITDDLPTETSVGDDEDLSTKLAEAVQPVLDGEDAEPSHWFRVGSAFTQWVLVEDDDPENAEGYLLRLQVQVDERAPGGVELQVTKQMLDSWFEGKGLQKNRTEHKRFAAGLVEKAIELSSYETGNALIFALEEAMLRGRGLGEPERDEHDLGEAEADYNEPEVEE